MLAYGCLQDIHSSDYFSVDNSSHTTVSFGTALRAYYNTVLVVRSYDAPEVLGGMEGELKLRF